MAYGPHLISIALSCLSETERLGESLGKELQPGDILALHGDLGAGKTVLAKSIVRASGYSGLVSSPTFTIMNAYEGPVRVLHVDTYRLTDPYEVGSLGFSEYIDAGWAAVVEWADRIPDLLPDDHLAIELSQQDGAEGGRVAALRSSGPRSHGLLGAVERAFESAIVAEKRRSK